jgi:DNA polymerase I-like protein with 3'-5' exonuclease and polymerase domains
MIHSRFKGGVIANLDFKSLEVYIMALISKDHSLTQVLLNNEDVHKHNASVAFGVPEDEVTKDLRTTAKAVTFG